MAVVGAAIPLIVLFMLIERRRKHFHEQLPDTLGLIAGSLRSGYSFLQAISVAVEETLPPTSTEFKRVLAENRLGRPLQESLENMAKRMQETDFDWTVMAINIQREVGGNLAEVLEIIADTVRERDRVRRQIRILTAEGRISVTILMVLPFFEAFLLYLMNPSYMSLLTTTRAGLVMLTIGLISMTLGYLWLRKIVYVEV